MSVLLSPSSIESAITGRAVGAWDEVKRAFLRTDKTQILLRGTLASLVVRACGLGLRFLLGIILARLLRVSAYGVYAYAVTWLGLLTIPAMLGLDQVLLRYVAVYKETQSWALLKGLLRFSLLVGAAAATVVSLVSIVVVAVLHQKDWDFRVTMWITLAVLPIVVLAQLRQSALRGLDRPGAAQVPENLIYPGLVITFVTATYFTQATPLTVPQAAALNAAAWLCAFLVGTILLVRSLPRPLKASERRYDKTAWLGMVPHLIFSAGAYQILSRADIVILGALRSSQEVGLYVVASRAAELMLFIYDTVTLAGAPVFSSIYISGDRHELQRFTRLATRTIFWLSLPLYAVLIFFAPWFLSFFGVEFVNGANVMRLLATTLFLSSSSGFVQLMLYAVGYQREVAIAMGITAALNVGLCLLLVPSYGMLGAALASGASLLALKGSLVFVLYKKVGIVALPFMATARREPGKC